MGELKDLVLNERRLSGELHDNRKRQQEINQEAWLKRHGVSIGDMVAFHQNGFERQGMLVKLVFASDNNFNYPCVQEIKPNGKMSLRHTKLYGNAQATIKKFKVYEDGI